MKKYNHKEIEKKWQKEWIKKGIYKTKEGGDKPKYYVLDMFPYPSGAGLHVGHPKGYIATDVIARMKMMLSRIKFIHRWLRKKTSKFLKSSWNFWVLPMIGTEKLILPTRLITNGRSGRFWKCLKKVWFMNQTSLLTGARDVKPVWLMKIWKEDFVNVVVL